MILPVFSLKYWVLKQEKLALVFSCALDKLWNRPFSRDQWLWYLQFSPCMCAWRIFRKRRQCCYSTFRTNSLNIWPVFCPRQVWNQETSFTRWETPTFMWITSNHYRSSLNANPDPFRSWSSNAKLLASTTSSWMTLYLRGISRMVKYPWKWLYNWFRIVGINWVTWLSFSKGDCAGKADMMKAIVRVVSICSMR